MNTIDKGLKNLDGFDGGGVYAFWGLRILPDTGLHRLAVNQGMTGADEPLLRPAFYLSPALDDPSLALAMVRKAFRGRENRFLPMESNRQARQRQLLHRRERLKRLSGLWTR